MAHQNKASSVFDLLREYDVELSPQVQLILEKLKFNSVRTISMINIEKLEHLELDVRSLFASDEELLKMTQEDRIALFGEFFADKPQQFKLLAGEKCSIHAAVTMCKRLVQSYEKCYLYDKFKNVTDLQRKKRQVQRHNANTDNIILDIDQTNSAEGTEEITLLVRRKGKTLQQYIQQWFLSTKLKLNVTSTDFEVVDNGIKCTKCSNRPFKVTVDSSGGWKISSYMTHLRTAHKMPDEVGVADNTGNTNNGRNESNDDNAANEDDNRNGEPPRKNPRLEESDFSQSTPTTSQSTST
jgi:hypothetical protein